MIDFRYHIVSLISVFLALAVGIALGAGPLKETIGDTLTGQVEQLRAEKDTLRTQLDESAGDLADTTAYVDAAAPQLLAGALTDRRVAVIALGPVDDDRRKAVDDRLAQAGASVTAHVTLTESWTDPDVASYRQALVGNILTLLDPVPGEDEGAQTDLTYALIEGLTGADPASPDTLTLDASSVLEVLSGGDSPLVTLQDPVETPADAVVVLAPAEQQGSDDASPTTAADQKDLVDAQLGVLTAAQKLTEGAVLADGALDEGSLTEAVLADDELASTLTTVSESEEVPGQVSVPLALAARIGGVNGHYGFGDGLTVMPEPVTLTPVDRTPQSALVPPTGETQG
ncbi:hypothetical protein Cch01nite_16450 [Cellulomonas chitinilytica]|uniref:Copper transporter n=1 Tax=Cellulomonas chitinilytica TaxID=398759 RepID=A0A919P059_9CELL|nr:copper transporter [Cellulomonas chitinilytica]GIG20921.1 hypothetical protein Cch01nite_16450 [Cellulomonas chitinilytica]